MKVNPQTRKKPAAPRTQGGGALSASVLTAAVLTPLANGYSIHAGTQRSIVVPNASKLAALQDVTVTGTLLKKQLVTLTGPNRRQAHLAANGGTYTLESDGDLHFDLGTRQLQPHIACELQNASSWLTVFQKSIGATLSVSGFFRCLFEHPGFRSNDDAHIFEIHPVRAVTINGKMQAFDVDIPDQDSIHTWTSPVPLQDQDGRIRVEYNSAGDTLTLSGMDGRDENYVSVAGRISSMDLHPNSNTPATFSFGSPDIGKTLKGVCLKGTSAAKQLAALSGGANVQMIALRNIDLAQALRSNYVISLLAIDIRAR